MIDLYLQDCSDRRSAARVSELATFAGVGPQHLNRVFRDVFGKAPGAVLRERRLARAAQLLRSALAVSDIAAMSGFGTDRTFFRAFTRAFRVSPDEYRRQATKCP